MSIDLLRDGEKVGEADELSRFSMRTRALEACVFWTSAPVLPGEVLGLRVDTEPLLMIQVVQRPPSGEAAIRASAFVLGPASDDRWQLVRDELAKDGQLQRMLRAEAERW